MLARFYMPFLLCLAIIQRMFILAAHMRLILAAAAALRVSATFVGIDEKDCTDKGQMAIQSFCLLLNS